MTSKSQVRAEPDAGKLTGAEKVAVLLLALGRPKAARLLTRFGPDEIRQIASVANELPSVSPGDLAVLVEDFAKTFSGGVNFVGTASEVRGLLSDLMSEDEITAMLEDRGEAPLPPEGEPVWAGFSRLKDDSLRDYLVGEHPQLAATILSRIDSATSARILGSLAPDFRNMLLWRMLSIKTVADDALEALELALKEDLIALSSSAVGPHTGIADILNRLDKSQSDDALRLLAEVRPADVRMLRSMLFTFEDLYLLSQRSLSTVLNQVPVDQLVTSLHGTDPSFQAIVLGVLGARARRMVEAELQPGREAPAKDTAEARRAIVDLVLRLVAQGQVELPSTDENHAA